MWNFKHEVLDSSDKNIRFFLYNDFFHDGRIHSISLNDNDVELVISCEREWANDFNLKENGYHPDSEAYKFQYSDKYKYRLTFFDCRYFIVESEKNDFEFINGRFKQSAKLLEVAKSDKRKKYHHYRIQLNEGGFIDLIFNRFAIKNGIKPIHLERMMHRKRVFEFAKNQFETWSLESVFQVAKIGDDLDRAAALNYMNCLNESKGLEIAKDIVSKSNHDDEELLISSIYTIGLWGNQTDLESLKSLYFEQTKSIEKRHILDNIEKIEFRSKS